MTETPRADAMELARSKPARPMRLSLLTNMVAPYRVPLFKALASSPQIAALRVLTCVEREADRQWRVVHDDSYIVKQLAGITLNLRRGDAMRILHLRFGIIWELIRYRPDRLIIGDASWTSYLAMFACMLLRVPYVVWNEITTSSKVSGGMVARLRRLLYRHARTCIASGKLARDFLIQEGCQPDKIFIANNAVDNDYFLAQKARWAPQRDELRHHLGIAPETFALLYVGQLISRKRVLETLEAAAAAAKQVSLHLLMAGSGPLKARLRKRAAELGFSQITFCGHVQPERLCQLYAACDGVVLLSEDEPWGMVVNEALLNGKPFLGTVNVGAAVEFANFRECVLVPALANAARHVEMFVRHAMQRGITNSIELVSPPIMSEHFLIAIKERNR